MRRSIIVGPLLLLLFQLGCRKPAEEDPSGPSGHSATPYALDVPLNFPPMPIPVDNPLTVEGVKLGRHLFYEPRLSGDNSMSCASCHVQSHAFTDPARFSTGIDGIQGSRQSMSLVNLGWEDRFFWDGRAMTLEEQIFFPVRDPIELHDTWPNAVSKLQADAAYVQLFSSAFGTSTVDSTLVSKAIAQFLRTLISGNSKFDRFMRGDEPLSVEEQLGFALTLTECGPPTDSTVGQFGGDCFHCHTHGGGRFTDGILRNNGLDTDEQWTDLGLGGVTGLPQDFAKFKTPSLRNVAVTAPYMHDGRFETLEDVIDFYDSGRQPSTTLDPNMKCLEEGLQLTPAKKQQLLAFLHTLTDWEFINDERFSDPGAPQ